MASKTLLVILGLALVIAAVSSFELKLENLEQELSEDLTVADLQDYFQEMQMEKRGSKVGGKLNDFKINPSEHC